MRKRVTFRHMETEPDLETHAYTALDRIEMALEHEQSPINLDLVLSPGRPHAHHQVELLIKTPNHDFVIKEEGPHMYQLIDKACDVAYRKIHDHKDKLVSAQRRQTKV